MQRTVLTSPALSGPESAARYGLIGHAYPQHQAANNSTALTAGTLYVAKIVAESTATSATRTVRFYQSAASSSVTLAKCAAFDSSGAQLGSSSSDFASTINGSGTVTRSITVGTFALTRGTDYYAALLCVGGTGPTLGRSASSPVANGGLSGASLLWATGATGLTDMPTSITPASLTSLPIALWFGLL